MASTPARAFRPVRPDGLVDELAARCRSGLAHPFRVLIDGADATHPKVLAAALAQWLRTSGRPCAQVDLHDWLRPASLRLEHGHNNQDSYQDHWFDYAALRREVLEPLGPGGSRMWLPTLRDPHTDRSTRVQRVAAPAATVLLVSGPMLLGRDLPTDLTVHLHVSEATMTRRTPTEQRWTVAPLLAQELVADSDAVADVVIRADHPNRPAVRFR